MNINSILLRILAVAVCVAALTIGCGPRGERCGKCGMLVDDHPRWVAGMITASGEPQRFCCPRCLFAHGHSPRGSGGRDAWVTEYYTQQRLSVTNVLFVMGSDLTGPMGKALVPIAGRTPAEQFMKDHRGTRVLTVAEITPDLLREIAGKPALPTSPAP